MAVFWALVALFAILNSFGNVPILMALTANQTLAERRSPARRPTTFAFLIIVFFGFLGQDISS
ncbi:MAG: hypothetical protein M0Z41_12990 [Peptococcaceae bacterium]|nr:hypothetical protein [Peptococcaceae bacterium]